jgi:hypothetical protein
MILASKTKKEETLTPTVTAYGNVRNSRPMFTM